MTKERDDAIEHIIRRSEEYQGYRILGRHLLIDAIVMILALLFSLKVMAEREADRRERFGKHDRSGSFDTPRRR